MPTIQDMGITAALTPGRTVFNDTGIVLQALALREQKRQARVDEEMRGRQFDQSKKEFERSAGQADQRIGLGREELGLRKQSFKVGLEDRQRAMGQELAAQGMFAELAEREGLFRKTGPDGAEYSIPGAREQFLGMAPDDQQRAIGVFKEEQAQQEQVAQLTKLGTMLEGMTQAGFMQPEEAQAALAAAEADPRMIGEMYGQIMQGVQQRATQQFAQQQRQQSVEGATQTIQMLQQTGFLKPELASAHMARLLDPDAKPTQIIKDAIDAAEQDEADKLYGAEMRVQTSRVSALEAQFENARQLAALIPVSAVDERLAAEDEVAALLETLNRERAKLDRLIPRSEGLGGQIMPGDPGYDQRAARAGLTDQAETPEQRVLEEAWPEGRAALPSGHAKTVKPYIEKTVGGQTAKPPAPGPSDDDIDLAIKKAKEKLGKKAKPEDIEAEVERLLTGDE